MRHFGPLKLIRASLGMALLQRRFGPIALP